MQYKIKQNTIIKCKYCNNKFHPTSSNNKYCSKECSKIGKSINRKRLYRNPLNKKVNCLYCGKLIHKRTSNKFCCSKCRLLYRNLKRSKTGNMLLNKLKRIYIIYKTTKEFQIIIKGFKNNCYWELYKNNKCILKSGKFNTIKEAKKDARLACK